MHGLTFQYGSIYGIRVRGTAHGHAVHDWPKTGFFTVSCVESKDGDVHSFEIVWQNKMSVGISEDGRKTQTVHDLGEVTHEPGSTATVALPFISRHHELSSEKLMVAEMPLSIITQLIVDALTKSSAQARFDLGNGEVIVFKEVTMNHNRPFDWSYSYGRPDKRARIVKALLSEATRFSISMVEEN